MALPTQSMVNDADGKNRDLLTPSYLHYPEIAKLFSERTVSPADDVRQAT
jgi:hypothetical protein